MAGKKLLVVDDSLTIQKVIRLALSNEGYEIQASSDGNDALQQISLFRPDVVLIDVSLPGKSAFEVKTEVNEQHDLERTRFVLMSSAFEQVDENMANQVGFHARLIKPFDPAHLRQVLVDALSTQPEEPKHASAASVSKDPPALSEDLWENEPQKNPRQTPPPAHLGSAHPTESDDISDIRQLTESTIKMSGLDEMDWSVNESAKKDVPAFSDNPSIEPFPQMADTGGSKFKFDPDQAPDSITESRYGDLPVTPPPPKADKPAAPVHSHVHSPAHSPAHAQAQVAPVSSGDVEEAVRRHLEGTLERMALKMLPELAEKIIRQEIHKMLSEQP